MNKQEKPKILITCSLLEAALLVSIRKYDFGKFTVFKQNGEPFRLTYEGVELLHEQDGSKIAHRT